MDDSLKEEISTGKNDLNDYFNARFDLLRLNMAENFAKVISGFIIKSVLFFVTFFAVMFMSFAGAVWLNDLYGSHVFGFITVAGLYIIFAIIFWFIRHNVIEKPIIESMIDIFFPPEQNIDQLEEDE